MQAKPFRQISGAQGRYATAPEIGVEHNSTIIAMLPVELLHAARKIAGLPQDSSE
jgi:hypothetical protein